MKKVASITRYQDSEKVIKWLNKLPQKISIEDIEILLKIANSAKYLLWTEKHGIKLLK